ncbi:MAG: hypothetical protein FJX76_18455 [Armatimonadetes bacterium]|nr:hypothetical protein [Armatimonadota bacterium]
MIGLAPDFPIETTQIPEYYPPQERAFVDEVIVPSMLEKGHWKGETFFRHWQTERPIPVSDEPMTAHAMTGDRERCLECGLDDNLSKPLRRSEVRAVVRRWIPALGDA